MLRAIAFHGNSVGLVAAKFDEWLVEMQKRRNFEKDGLWRFDIEDIKMTSDSDGRIQILVLYNTVEMKKMFKIDEITLEEVLGNVKGNRVSRK